MRRNRLPRAQGRSMDIGRNDTQCLPHAVMRSRRVHAAFAQAMAKTPPPIPVWIARLIGVISFGVLSSQSVADAIPSSAVHQSTQLTAAAPVVPSAPRTMTNLTLGTASDLMVLTPQEHCRTWLPQRSQRDVPREPTPTAPR